MRTVRGAERVQHLSPSRFSYIAARVPFARVIALLIIVSGPKWGRREVVSLSRGSEVWWGREGMRGQEWRGGRAANR